MPNLPITQSEHDGKPNYERGKSAKYQSLYGRKWRQARIRFLAKHPLCVECEKEGKITPATEVDHIEKHGGDLKKFWDRNNWQGLCRICHSKKTYYEDGAFGRKPIRIF